MFRRECSLCGGKLDSSNICRECGLDNNKSDANYVMNRSSCDGQPLTHVHEERKTSRHDYKGKNSKKKQQPQQIFQNTYSSGEKYVRKTNKKSGGKAVKKAAIIVVIISILGEFASFIPDILDNIGGVGIEEITRVFEEDFDYGPVPEPEYYDEDYDPYEYVTREIPAEGEEYSAELWQGEYVIGIHIPEGIYMCTANGGYASFGVQDEENSIWLYEWVDGDQPEYIDLRLYEGAILEVMGDTPLEVSTTNSQGGLRYNSNPLGERTAYIQSGAVAGEAFEPSVYHLHADKGYGQVIVEIVDEGGAVIESKYLWMDADYDMESNYMNLVLPEGAVISWENYEELEVSLVSSGQIATDDYLGYYGY